MEAICSVLVDEKPDMRQQCTLTGLKANCSLGCSNRGGQQAGRELYPLLCPCDSLPAVLCPVLGLPAQERCGSAEVGPEKATKMLRGLEHFCYGEV